MLSSARWFDDMPRPLHPCANPGCANLTDRSRCAHCRKQGSARPNSNARRYTKRWRRYALAYIARHPLCYYCEIQGLVTATECVDHATPASIGGDFWDTENHRPSCKRDNDSKGDRTEREYITDVLSPNLMQHNDLQRIRGQYTSEPTTPYGTTT